MAQPINHPSAAVPPQIPTPPNPNLATNSEQPQAFRNMLLQGLDQVNTMQLDADAAVQQLVTGADVNSAEVMTAVQKADMAFQLMMQIRNKLMQAFNEVKELRI